MWWKMWRVVSLAAISVSADLLELWFLGDLLGIFCVSVAFFLVFGVTGVVVTGVVVLSSLALVVFSVSLFLSLFILEGMRYCG